MNDPGPQKSPKSVHAVQAESKQTSRELARCDSCGRFLDLSDSQSRRMTIPDNAFSGEEWEDLCKACFLAQGNDTEGS